MLPAGLTADLLDPAEQRTLKRLLPEAQTGDRLMHGACSDRNAVLAALERHRRFGEGRARPEGHWPQAVAEFVVEHARNAGPTLFFLRFSHEGGLGELPPGEAMVRPARQVREAPGGWLPEERPVLVVP